MTQIIADTSSNMNHRTSGNTFEHPPVSNAFVVNLSCFPPGDRILIPAVSITMPMVGIVVTTSVEANL